jgi:dinuclear metal center YbgI/SA1388 family protein
VARVVNVGDLVRAMEAIAPLRFAAPWDNVGLIVGDQASPLARVLLTIDCTSDVLEEARRERVDAIVSYHPPIFAAVKRLLGGSIAHDAARAGIAIHSPHTALDVADGGTNDVLADALSMIARKPLRPLETPGAEARGMGRVGSLDAASVAVLVGRIKRALSIAHVLVAGRVDRDVTRAAVCAGSGGDLLGDAIESGAELFLTGELRHHDALRAAAAGLTVVCTLHSASERAALVALEGRLAERLAGVSIVRSRVDREPFVFD